MILTTCAACAAPLAHNAPRCVRCHLRLTYALSLYVDDSSRVAEALAILEDIHPPTQRIFGHFHPLTRRIQNALSKARECLADAAAAGS